MPTISRFYGIIIYMNYRDHEPPPYHVRYQGYEASIEIENGTVTGTLPMRALRLVFEWQDLHKDELQANWIRARKRVSLLPIEPLR
jgi:hypothetical protein